MNNFYKRLIVFIFAIILCPSCAYSKKGPYKVEPLTRLKSENDSLYLSEYYNQCWFAFNNTNDMTSVIMKYDIENKNIVASNFDEKKTQNYDQNEIEYVKSFLDTYFFITKEKLPIVFPVEEVSAEVFVFPTIIIKKYNSNNDKEEKNFHRFEYGFRDGFLFLASYKYYVNNSLATTRALTFRD